MVCTTYCDTSATSPPRRSPSASLRASTPKACCASSNANGPFAFELAQHAFGVDALKDALGDLRGGEVADVSQYVVQTIAARGAGYLRAVLQVFLDTL